MVISKNSQLGLMMDDKNIALEFLKKMMERNDDLLSAYTTIKDIVEKKEETDGAVFITEEEIASVSGIISELDIERMSNLSICEDEVRVKKAVNNIFSYELRNFIDNKDSKLYLICDGVEKCSKMIRIGDNFSSKALRNIKFGKHTYLLGRDEVCRFICREGAIKGIYWNRKDSVCFEFGFDLEGDGYYFDNLYTEHFNKVAKIITFVELGDIDVLMLEKGRNNGKPKEKGKITNTSPFTVYVVDSSWNQLIIRTEGFAVMGHFRLQPCGTGLADRKLIWINAFEKHGYKRQPKAKIIHY